MLLLYSVNTILLIKIKYAIKYYFLLKIHFFHQIKTFSTLNSINKITMLQFYHPTNIKYRI